MIASSLDGKKPYAPIVHHKTSDAQLVVRWKDSSANREASSSAIDVAVDVELVPICTSAAQSNGGPHTIEANGILPQLVLPTSPPPPSAAVATSKDTDSISSSHGGGLTQSSSLKKR